MRHWLFTLLRNQRVSDIRRLIREQRAGADEPVVAFSPVSPDPHARIALLELGRAIAALPEARRQVVLLIRLEEMTYGEAAEILGVPVGTVRSRLARARASLRKSLLADPQIAKPITATDGARHERIAA